MSLKNAFSPFVARGFVFDGSYSYPSTSGVRDHGIEVLVHINPELDDGCCRIKLRTGFPE
jgi:hypothetical protein